MDSPERREWMVQPGTFPDPRAVRQMIHPYGTPGVGPLMEASQEQCRKACLENPRCHLFLYHEYADALRNSGCIQYRLNNDNPGSGLLLLPAMSKYRTHCRPGTLCNEWVPSSKGRFWRAKQAIRNAPATMSSHRKFADLPTYQDESKTEVTGSLTGAPIVATST